MKCLHILVILSSQLLGFVGFANGEKCYGAQFTEDVWGCADFDNKMLQCDTLHLGTVDGKEDELGLSGVVTVGKEIEDGTKAHVEIWKVLDIGKEFMYHIEGDICDSLKDDQTVWYPLVQAMKIEKCPIAVDDYTVKDMTINLEHSKGMLTHELCGEYIIQLSTSKGESTDKDACFELGIAVTEYDC